MEQINAVQPVDGAVGSNSRETIDAFAERLERMLYTDLPRACVESNELIARSELLGYSSGVLRGKLLKAFCLRQSGEATAARALAEEVIDLARACGNLGAEALGMLEVGVHNQERGDIRECERLLADARAVALRSGDVVVEARIMVSQATMYLRLDNLDEAIVLCLQACDVATRANAAGVIAPAMYALCAVRYLRGEGAAALECCDALVEFAEGAGNSRYRVLAREFKALIHRELGGEEPQFDAMIDALEFWRQQGDRRRAGATLANIGITYKQVGNFACALEALLESLEQCYQSGDRDGEAVRLLMLAQVYQAIGEEWRELDCCMQGLQRARARGNRGTEAGILVALGSFYLNRGEIARALAYCREAEALVETCSVRSTQIDMVVLKGCAHVLVGAFDRAEQHLIAALRLARSFGMRRSELSILADLGILEVRRGNDAGALDYLRASLALADDDRYRTKRTEILAELVRLCGRIGDAAARAEYEREYAALAQSIFSGEAARSLRRIIRRHRNIELAIGDVEVNLGAETTRLLRSWTADHESSTNNFFSTWHEPPFARVRSGSGDAWPAADDGLARLDRLPDKPVCIRAFGVLRIDIEGRVLRKGDWGRRRAREVFKLLLINHGRWLSIDEIHEVLWEGKPSRNPDVLIANAVSHLRRAFARHAGEYADAAVVQCLDGAYRLHLGDAVWVDFFAFKELVFAARRVTAAADRLDLYTKAADLYAGDFLAEDQYGDWAAFERDTLRSGYLEALEFIATEHGRLGRNTDAIEAAWRLLRVDPTNHTALEALVRAMVAEGRASEARRILAERTPQLHEDADGRKLGAYLSALIR